MVHLTIFPCEKVESGNETRGEFCRRIDWQMLLTQNRIWLLVIKFAIRAARKEVNINSITIIWNIPTGGTILSPQTQHWSSAMLHTDMGEYDPISQPHRANGINLCWSSTSAVNIRYIPPAGTMSIALLQVESTHLFFGECWQKSTACMHVHWSTHTKQTNKQTSQPTNKQAKKQTAADQ